MWGTNECLWPPVSTTITGKLEDVGLQEAIGPQFTSSLGLHRAVQETECVLRCDTLWKDFLVYSFVIILLWFY